MATQMPIPPDFDRFIEPMSDEEVEAAGLFRLVSGSARPRCQRQDQVEERTHPRDDLGSRRVR